MSLIKRGRPVGSGVLRDIFGRRCRPSAVPHRRRPAHDLNHPVHVTWRIVRGMPSLRLWKNAGIVGRTIRACSRSHERRRTGFRVVHFSIQSNHLHLIVEAGDKDCLTAGLRGLAIWIARRLNDALSRQGRVFAERYHARALTNTRDTRNVIVYVLQNHLHHQPSPYLVDPCSSASWFDGWERPVPTPAAAPPVSPPDTWLLRLGWRLGGTIRFSEGPRS